MRILLKELKEVLLEIFIKYNFTEKNAHILGNIFAESTLDGVNSHGINRVPLFIDYVKNKTVNVDAEAKLIDSFGMMERWDGQTGPGIINASKCTERSIELSKTHGMGLVALRNTNHWMRGGTYGWQAADAGCISILFTNTQANMPPWGGIQPRIGNNPIVVAIPRKNGHVMLDMAMSQYSFGKINEYKLSGKKLPFPGGWDQNNQLSDDPEKISYTMRGLPIGYWKGSALSMILDMLATILSAGDSTRKITQKPYESSLSQIFICIDPDRYGDRELQGKLINEIINYTREVDPLNPGERTYYPGEQTLQKRVKNLKHGILISDSVWEKIIKL